MRLVANSAWDSAGFFNPTDQSDAAVVALRFACLSMRWIAFGSMRETMDNTESAFPKGTKNNVPFRVH